MKGWQLCRREAQRCTANRKDNLPGSTIRHVRTGHLDAGGKGGGDHGATESLLFCSMITLQSTSTASLLSDAGLSRRESISDGKLAELSLRWSPTEGCDENPASRTPGKEEKGKRRRSHQQRRSKTLLTFRVGETHAKRVHGSVEVITVKSCARNFDFAFAGTVLWGKLVQESRRAPSSSQQRASAWLLYWHVAE
eukprot:2140731-Rhodomonas_salina.1